MRSQRVNSTTSSLAHIQVGQRANPSRAARGSAGAPRAPVTAQCTLWQSGQSPSTPTKENPFSAINRRVSAARQR